VARIALDIDSTLHPYWDLLQRIVLERYGVELPYEEQYEWGISALERDAVIHCVEESHSDDNILAGVPYENAVETVRDWHAAGHWIHVTSHRRAQTAAATARWLDRIGLPYDDLHCSFDKVTRCTELEIDVLVDDSPVNIVRAREAAQEAQKRARQQLQSFLLRHGRVYSGRSSWSLAHRRWISTLKFEHPAHLIVLQEYCQAVEDAEVRLRRLTDLIAETVRSWTMAPVVEAYQALRGVSLMAAVVFVAEIGDIRRFENPRQLMAFLGLVPSESSTGEHVKRGGITKAGNSRARRMLVEGAWAYRFPARVSRSKQAQLEGLPRTVREIAWKGQLRLCSRYRNMILSGKHKAIAITAIAREMAAFLWAIGQEVQPAHHA